MCKGRGSLANVPKEQKKNPHPNQKERCHCCPLPHAAIVIPRLLAVVGVVFLVLTVAVTRVLAVAVIVVIVGHWHCPHWCCGQHQHLPPVSRGSQTG